MFYIEILEQTGPGSAFLDHLEAQILKNLRLSTNHACMFVGSMYVPVSDVYRNFFGRPISAEGFFWGGEGEGNCDTPLRVQGKGVVGTRWQSSQKLQGFSTQKSLTFD